MAATSSTLSTFNWRDDQPTYRPYVSIVGRGEGLFWAHIVSRFSAEYTLISRQGEVGTREERLFFAQRARGDTNAGAGGPLN